MIDFKGGTILPVPYQIQVDYQGGQNPVYVGFAPSGSLTRDSTWQIKRITYDANNNPVVVQFANGTNLFVNIWDQRTTYTYA